MLTSLCFRKQIRLDSIEGCFLQMMELLVLTLAVVLQSMILLQCT